MNTEPKSFFFWVENFIKEGENESANQVQERTLVSLGGKSPWN